jgi:uncharacterized protein
MKNIVGAPVRGDDFFGRERELQDLLEAIQQQHLLMLAPRRVGKTSLLRALGDQLDQTQEMTPVYVSVAAARDELEFIRIVSEAIYRTPVGRKLQPNPIARWMARRKQRVKKIGAIGAVVELESIERTWQPKAEELFEKLLAQPRPWLLMIDELPNLVIALAEQDPTGTRAQTFLHWFRDLRQRPAAMDKLRFILAGSIGLDALTRRHNLSATVNDLLDWRLGAYDDSTAERFLSKLGESAELPLSPEMKRHIMSETEWCIPYHLQVIFNELQKRVRGRAVERADVTAVVEDLLSKRLYFNTWQERLSDAFGKPDVEYAELILARCAARVEGVKRDTLENALAKLVPDRAPRVAAFKWILDVLEHDGYLIAEADRLRFRSGLLRRYWQRNCS